MPTHDVNARVIVGAGLGIGLMVILVVLTVFLLLNYWDLSPRADSAQLPYQLVVEGAALESAPQFDLARYRSEKRELLESSEWVDAQRGIVRIPIANAMDILARPAASAAGPSGAHR